MNQSDVVGFLEDDEDGSDIEFDGLLVDNIDDSDEDSDWPVDRE